MGNSELKSGVILTTVTNFRESRNDKLKRRGLEDSDVCEALLSIHLDELSKKLEYISTAGPRQIQIRIVPK